MSENTEIVAALERAIELARDQLEAWSGSQQNRSDIATLTALRDAIKAGVNGPDDFVQVVPNHCDRIVWRNRYYHLPLAIPHATAVGEGR